MKAAARALWPVAASAAMLAIAWRLAGGAPLLDRLAAADPAWLAAGLALTVPMQALSALRWAHAAHRLGAPLRFGRALAEYYFASLLNAVVPGGVAGDAARVWRHGRRAGGAGRGRYRSALHAAMLERFSGQVALALVLLGGLAGSAGAVAGAGPAVLALLAGGVLLLPAAGLAASVALGEGTLRQRLDALLADVRRVHATPAALCTQLGLSLGVVVAYVATFHCAARAAGQPLDAPAAALVVPLVLFAMAVPISVGGLGPRELSAAALWPLLGLSAADGVAAALLYGAIVTAGALPGLLPLARARSRTPAEGPGGPGALSRPRAGRSAAPRSPRPRPRAGTPG